MLIKNRFMYFAFANALRAILGLALLPIVTSELDASDFGVFAIVMALGGAAVGFSGLGSAQLLSAHLPVVTGGEKRSLVTTLMLMSMFVALTISGGLYCVWPILSNWSEEIAAGRGLFVLIIILLMMFWTPWTIASAVTTIEGRALSFASVVIAEALSNAVGVLLFLFYFELAGLSLILGALFGASVNMIGSLIVLRKSLGFVFSTRWARESLTVGAISVWSGVGEKAVLVLERIFLSAHASTAAVGFLSHAQQYQGIARMGMKSWANSFWPETLKEARDPNSDFTLTSNLYLRAQLLLAILGVCMATAGHEAITILTNGKLSDAYFPAVILLVLVQIEYMARPQLAILFAYGRYIEFQSALFGSQILALFAIFPAISLAGIYGALGVQTARVILFRYMVVYFANKIRVFAFKDHIAISGVAGTLLIFFWGFILEDLTFFKLVVGGVIACGLVGQYLYLLKSKK